MEPATRAGADTALRVLLVTTGYPPDASGSGRRLHALYQRLKTARPNIDWTVVTKRPPASAASAVPGPTAVHDFRSADTGQGARKGGGVVAEILWAIGLLRRGLLDDIDLLHVAGWTWYSLILSLVARRRGIPIVRELTTFGDTGAVGGAGRYFIRWTNRLAASFVSISPALEASLRSTGVDKSVWVRPNGVDTNRFRPPTPQERSAARDKIKHRFAALGDDDLIVLHIGRIRPLKNQVFLARCVALLPENFKLLIAGPAFDAGDPYMSELKEIIAGGPLAGRATVIEGFHEDVRPFYRAADIFAFPSTNEGLGNVMLEALCCGLPVAANTIENVTDWIIRPGGNGALGRLEIDEFGTRIREAARLCRRASIWKDAHARFDQDIVDKGYLRLLDQTTECSK